MAKEGRPTKLTNKLINILNDVVENALYYTDEDLVEELNSKLEPEERIKQVTFKAYKNGKNQTDNPLMSEFISLIKKALRKEKNELLSNLKKGEAGWQAKAWILERKFNEWNLRKISETDITTKGESINNKINITVNSEEEKKQIDEFLDEV